MNFWYTELTHQNNNTVYLLIEVPFQTQNQLYKSALALLTKPYVIQ